MCLCLLHYRAPCYRQEFIVSKVIKNQEDEADEEFQEGKVNLNFTIHNSDDSDWLTPEEQQEQDEEESKLAGGGDDDDDRV